MIEQVFGNEYFKLMSLIIREKNTQEELEYIKQSEDKIRSNEFYEVALEHELVSTIGAKLVKKIGLELGDPWKMEMEETRARLGFLFAKVEELGADLKANGIPLILLKNGGIAIDIMDDLAECPMGDIDMLCRKSDFHKAHDIILKHGFNFKFRSIYEFENLDEAFADGSTEYSIQNSEETAWVELAWRPVAGRWIRKDKEPKADALVEASHKAKRSVNHVLSNEDNLLQVSCHTAKHSYVRAPGYRLHLDVDRIVSNNDIDWDLFIKKVYEVHSRVAVYFSLYLAQEILGTKIPAHVLDALCPSKSKEKNIMNMLLKANLMHPHGRKFSKLGFLRFQTALYDSLGDFLAVLFPPSADLKLKYKYNTCLLTPYYWCWYVLDMVGIRKSKKA
nr:nucleotidyltransferase family protein [uncultured Bacteroides sp.]